MDFQSFFAQNTKPKPEFEKFIDEALTQLNRGNDGDETYHPLYKAWRAIQANPGALKEVVDPGKVGLGLMYFLSYGTVTDIDYRQQIASLSYLMSSKAIYEGSEDLSNYKSRILILQQHAEAMNYTISYITSGNNFFDLSMNPFKSRDANWKMQYSDLFAAPMLLSQDHFASIRLDIESKIHRDFFLPLKTSEEVRESGAKLHRQLYDYLVKRVLENEDIDF